MHFGTSFVNLKERRFGHSSRKEETFPGDDVKP